MQYIMRRVFSVILVLLPIILKANTLSSLNEIQITTAQTQDVQLTLNLSESVPYHTFYLTHPDRFVLDLNHTMNKANIKTLNLPMLFIHDIRSGESPEGNLRLVFDLKPFVQVNVRVLGSSRQAAQRFALLFKSTSPQKTSLTTAVLPKPMPVKTASSVSPVTPHKRWVVVIDPGHGGKDPGASGPSGVHEKDIVLGISRALYVDLSHDPNIAVYMTRYGDYYIGLRQRLQIARRDQADIFVAVHADAYRDEDSVGASVFALSLRGATSEAAKWLADKENYSELGGVNLSDKNDVLRSVLIDLSQTATISASLFLGTDVLKKIAGVSPLHKNKVEQAPFVVLKSPDIPSVLIETGFISNPSEEQLLKNTDYQKKMAQAINQGLERYLQQYGIQKAS